MRMQHTKEPLIKDTFRMFDRDADGYIEAKCVGIAMRSLGVNILDTDLNTMLGEKENAKLSYKDFFQIVNERLRGIDQEKELLNGFKMFDRQGNGSIPTSELKHVLHNLGERLSEAEINELITLGDPNLTGLIIYKDLIAKLLGAC